MGEKLDITLKTFSTFKFYEISPSKDTVISVSCIGVQRLLT